MGESDATRGDAETICQEIRRVGGKDCTATFPTSVAVSRCFTCPGVPRGVYWVIKSLGIPIIAVNLLDLPSPDGLLGVSIASGLVHVGSPRHCPTEFTGVRTGWPMASWWATRQYSNPWGRSWRRRLQHLGVGHGPRRPRFDGWKIHQPRIAGGYLLGKIKVPNMYLRISRLPCFVLGMW